MQRVLDQVLDEKKGLDLELKQKTRTAKDLEKKVEVHSSSMMEYCAQNTKDLTETYEKRNKGLKSWFRGKNWVADKAKKHGQESQAMQQILNRLDLKIAQIETPGGPGGKPSGGNTPRGKSPRGK